MKVLALCLFAVVSSFAFAQGAPDPGMQDDPCNMTYSGRYSRAEGPLKIQFKRTNANNVRVRLTYRNERFYGNGYCDDSRFDFDLDGGWAHSGRFSWNSYGYVGLLRGAQWVNGRQYQTFTLYPN